MSPSPIPSVTLEARSPLNPPMEIPADGGLLLHPANRERLAKDQLPATPMSNVASRLVLIALRISSRSFSLWAGEMKAR